MFTYTIDIEASKKHKGLVCVVFDCENNRRVAYVLEDEDIEKAESPSGFIINKFEENREILECITKKEKELKGEEHVKI